MKMIKLVIIIAFILFCFSGYSQSSRDSLLDKVENGNPTLISAEKLMESRIMESRTGLTPENPEVEFGYMWGNREEIGNRKDFTIMQSFDFPTTYSSRNKLSKIHQQQIALEYNATRQEIMLKAQKTWINRIYLNNMEVLLKERLNYAKIVSIGYERKLETGEDNQLNFNQARMMVISLENEQNLLQREFTKNNTELVNLTGGEHIYILDTVFPSPNEINLDTILILYREGYVNQLYEVEVEKKSKEVDVVFNQKLPKLKAGYYSENILDTKLQGVKAGITIPLWGNAHAVNSAKAELVFAETDAINYWQIQKNELKQKYEQWRYLKDRVTSLVEILEISNNEVLLRRAMEGGEISLTEYFFESDFYFQNIKNLLEFKKEMLLLEADLRKVYY